jgi:hypothetical protein
MKKLSLRDPIWIIFGIALLIRVIGIQWGLPNEIRYFSLHPDEEVNLLFARNISISELKFLPGMYNYGTLYLTLLRVVSDVVITYSGGLSSNGTMSPHTMGNIHLAGRLMNALFGAGLASLTFAIGRRHIGIIAAYFSAAMVCVAPALVVHSRFQTVDMLAALLALASISASLRVSEDNLSVMKYALWAGAFAGLSAGTKYIGVLALVALFTALFLRDKKLVLKHFPLSVIVCALTFFLSTPGIIFDQASFLRDFTFEMNHSKEGHGIVFAATSPSVIYLFGNLILGIGASAVVLGLSGVTYAVVKKNAWAVICSVFFIIFVLAISTSQIKFMRYSLPLIPIICLGLGYIIQEFKERYSMKWPVVVGAMIVAGLDKGGFYSSAVFTSKMLLRDVRDEAGIWVKKQNPKSISLASDPWFWSPTIHPEVPISRVRGPRLLRELWASWNSPKLSRYTAKDSADYFDWDVRTLVELKPEFVAFSSFEYTPIERMKSAKVRTELQQLFVDRYVGYVTELSVNYEKVYDNDPDHMPLVEDMEYVQPRIVIWKRKLN